MQSLTLKHFIDQSFIILGARESFQTWHNLAYYGHFAVFGTLAFFYLGGVGFCRRLQKQMGVVIPERKPVKKENGVISSADSSAKGTPISEKNFQLPPAVDSIIPPKAEL